MNETKDCPTDAMTSDFLEKLICVNIDPALISEFELLMKPVAINCQNEVPSTAQIGYGTFMSPIKNSPDFFKVVKVATLITGSIKIQNRPRKDCL